jgi:hypothetical protein
MITSLLSNKEGTQFPAVLCSLALDMFAIVQHWDASARKGAERGREFESILYRYCRARRLTLTERAGSRTLRGQASASGFGHESDGVIATPDLTVHLELKYLTGELGKNDLLHFQPEGPRLPGRRQRRGADKAALPRNRQRHAAALRGEAFRRSVGHLGDRA